VVDGGASEESVKLGLLDGGGCDAELWVSAMMFRGWTLSLALEDHATGASEMGRVEREGEVAGDYCRGGRTRWWVMDMEKRENTDGKGVSPGVQFLREVQ
jgi:hypothetical protein